MARLISNGIYFVSLFLMLMTQFDYTAAAYGSDQNCFLYEANSVTCPAGGTSNVADVVARFIPSKVVFVMLAPKSDIYAVIRSTFSYTPGVIETILFDAVIGYAFNFPNTNIYAYLNVVKCPFIRKFNNNNETVPYTRTLTFSMLYEGKSPKLGNGAQIVLVRYSQISISLSRQPQNGPCNIAGTELSSDSPLQVADLDSAGAMDIDGILSCSIRQLNTSPQDTAAAIRQTNSSGVNIRENRTGNFVYVSQSSPISAPCLPADVAVISNSDTARLLKYVQAALSNPGAPNAICNIVTAGAATVVLTSSSSDLTVTFTKLLIIGPPKTIIAIYVYTTPLIVYGAFLSLNRSC